MDDRAHVVDLDRVAFLGLGGASLREIGGVYDKVCGGLDGEDGSGEQETRKPAV